MKVTVLGAGLVGSPMALDLEKGPAFDVTVADLREESRSSRNPLDLDALAKKNGVTAVVEHGRGSGDEQHRRSGSPAAPARAMSGPFWAATSSTPSAAR